MSRVLLHRKIHALESGGGWDLYTVDGASWLVVRDTIEGKHQLWCDYRHIVVADVGGHADAARLALVWAGAGHTGRCTGNSPCTASRP